MSVIVFDYTMQVKSAVNDALIEAGEQVGQSGEDHAKDYCPVREGILKLSISHDKEATEDAVIVYVGTNNEYAPYVELGHHQQPGRYVPAIGKRLVRSWVDPRPFIRPAMENHLEEYEAIIAAVLAALS